MDRTELLHAVSACGHFLHHRKGRLPAQERILHIVHYREEISQRELQEILRLQQGSVSETVGKLEDKGLLLRRRDTQDQRKALLRLSEEGERAEREARERSEREDAALFDLLTAQEQEELYALLGKLLAGWKEHYAEEFPQRKAGSDRV